MSDALLVFTQKCCRIIFFYLSKYIGDVAQLQMSIGGRIRQSSCVGELVTFLCSVAANSHGWTIPTVNLAVTINRFIRQLSIPPFNITLVSDDGNVITTSLSVISHAGLNGTNISCSDSNNLIGETQFIVASVLGEFM